MSVQYLLRIPHPNPLPIGCGEGEETISGSAAKFGVITLLGLSQIAPLPLRACRGIFRQDEQDYQDGDLKAAIGAGRIWAALRRVGGAVALNQGLKGSKWAWQSRLQGREIQFLGKVVTRA